LKLKPCLKPKPDWIRLPLPQGETFFRLRRLLKDLGLYTVCEEALCPNIGECWGGGTATIMILGNTCTRACRFCSVRPGNPQGYVDPDEPRRVAEAVKRLGLRYVVLTSVDRDDLEDGGASHFAATIRAIRRSQPRVLVEALIPDFQGDVEALRQVVEAGPQVVGHNLETVERLTLRVRDRRAGYHLSLRVLKTLKELNPQLYTKSSLMVGLGERAEEVLQAMRDLRRVGVSFLTIGQYLQPTRRNLPVYEYVAPQTFAQYRRWAEELGFLYVASGPLVRSSYRAGELFLRHVIGEDI
jgi:lipoic acid synthetase